MTLASSFYQSSVSVKKGLNQFFNGVSGNKMLGQRGLQRSLAGVAFAGVGMAVCTTIGICIFDPTVHGNAVSANLIYLALTAESGFLPAQLDAIHLAGKHDFAQKKAIDDLIKQTNRLNL